MMPVNCSIKTFSVSTKFVRGLRFCFPSALSGSDGVVGVVGSEAVSVVASEIGSSVDQIVTMKVGGQ